MSPDTPGSDSSASPRSGPTSNQPSAQDSGETPAGTRLPDEEEATSVPGPDSSIAERQEPVAESAAGVFEKIITGRIQIPPSALATAGLLGWIIIIVWMVIQDNGAGRLSGTEGLEWFLVKAGIVTGVVVLVVGVPCGIMWYRQR